jgi:hypothetical protein
MGEVKIMSTLTNSGLTNVDLARLNREHRPNTPRTHDANGNRVDEPAQCRADLQAWPCDVRQLLSLLEPPEASDR